MALAGWVKDGQAWWASLVLACLVALAGCTPSMVLSPQLPISVEGPLEAPRIVFHGDFLGRPCVQSFGMRPHEGEGGWGFGTDPATYSCHKIPYVIYGETPPGYIESRPPPLLRADVVYVISAGGAVTYGGKLYMFHDGQWRRVR